MKKIGRDKGVPLIILGALVITIITYAVLLRMEKAIVNDFEKGKVLVLQQEMPIGTVCGEGNLSEMFREVEVDKRIIPSNSVKDCESLAGQRCILQLQKGTIVTESMFTGEKDYVESMNSPVIAGCKAEDLYQVSSGVLRKGDRINIYMVNEEMGYTNLLWEDLLVYETFDANGNFIGTEDTDTPAVRINLLLEEGNAERFYTELYKGSLRMVKVWD